MPGETHFFEDIYNRRKLLGAPSAPEVLARLKTLYRRYNEPDDQQRIEKLLRETSFERELDTASNSYESLFALFMEFQMSSVGKRRWGNNVPRDVYEIDKIMRIFPDAKVIACVRDIRDFLASYRDNWRGVSKEEATRIRALYHPAVISLLWRSSMRQLTAALRAYEGRIILNRYEDLVRDPEARTVELCRFIGEPFEPDMLNVADHNSSTDPKSGGIFASSIGRWRTSVSSDQAYIAELIAGRYLTRFGYERISPRPPSSVLLASFLTAPHALYKALHANAHKRGPLVPYLFRRIGALFRYDSHF